MLRQCMQVFLGIPRSDASEFYALRQWFAKLGWNVSLATTVCTLAIDDPANWSPPDGLGKALRSDDIKYDQVSGTEYTATVIEHLKRSARSDLLDMYTMALENKESSSVIRAKRASDGAVMGTLLMLGADSRLASLMPGFAKASNRGCIAAPVISPATLDRHSMLQGLVLLGVRQLKKQGVATVVFDKVSSHLRMRSTLPRSNIVLQVRDDSAVQYLYALGFQVMHTFDEVSGDPVHWTMTAPG